MHAEDKPLGSLSSERLVTWCPTMDLVAYVNNENNIVIHRLSWSKLTNLSEHSEKVSALCWSPDGKMLASGHADGRVMLYDVEMCESVASFLAHSRRITALTWTVCKGKRTSSLVPDRTTRFLPAECGGIEDNKTSSNPKTSSSEGFLDQKSCEMTVLLSGDDSGGLSLQVLGKFCIGSVQMLVQGQDQTRHGVEIKRMSVSDDLSRISVVCCTNGQHAAEKLGEAKKLIIEEHGERVEEGSLYMVVLNSDVLQLNSSQLLQVSSQAWIVEGFVSSLHHSLTSICQSWKQAWDQLSKKLQDLSTCLQQHDSSSNVESELITTIVCGSASPALQAFLVQLKEQGVRRLEKVVDTACVNIQQEAVQKMIPVLESLMFRVGELMGLARWEERFQHIGLREQALESLMKESTQCLHKVSELLTVTRRFQKGYGQFSQWLERMAFRLVNQTGSTTLSGEETLSISRFVEHHLTHNQISGVLQDISTSVISCFDEKRCVNDEVLNAFKAAGHSSLRLTFKVHLERLKDAVEFSFGETQQCISSKIAVDNVIRLSGFTDDKRCLALSSSGSSDSDEHVFKLIASKQQQDAPVAPSLNLLRIGCRPSRKLVSLSVASLQLTDIFSDTSISDLHFYSPDKVCLLAIGTSKAEEDLRAILSTFELEEVAWTPADALWRTKAADLEGFPFTQQVPTCSLSA